MAAHATLATLTGTVRDAKTGVPLAGALIVVEELSRVAVADSGGKYEVGRLPGGSYHLTVRCHGYAEWSLQALIPPTGRLEIDIALDPELMWLPPIEVRTPLAVRALDQHATTASADRTLTMAAIRRDPLLAEPDAFAALHGGAVTLEPETPSGVHVRGGAADQTAYLLDGMPVLSPYHAAGVFSAWNPDLLAEVSLATPASSTMQVDAASGAVEGRTRAPGARVGTQGSIGTAQARIAIDGPLGRGGAGFLLGIRSRVPNAVVGDRDPSYLSGTARDWLAKVELRALGGLVRLLAYDNHNALDAAAVVATGDTSGADLARNRFAWSGHSLGAEWVHEGPRTSVSVRAWNATAAATAAWGAASRSASLEASRDDYGLAVSAERRARHTTTSLGARMIHGSTSYLRVGDATAAAGWSLDGSAPIASLFAQQTRTLGPALTLELGLNLSAMQHRAYPAPRVALTWAVSDRMSLLGSASRTWQFTQSLRNAESVVGGIFPADLYVSAAAPGVPVLRSDLAVLGARYRASAALQLGLELYARGEEGLLLVAPVSGQPFATGGFAVGAGSVRGGSLDLSWSVARVGVTASYALQHLRYSYAGGHYIPGHGVAQQLELGVAYTPSPSWSFRLGAVGAVGRTATEVSGGFEWEACNLLDRGCEFGGSPTSAAALGTTPLPAYVRLDLGVRKQWNMALGGRPGTIAVFGTVTNLLGRSNVLTYSTDPVSGDRTAVDMRPRAPLVVGIDWGF